MTLAKHGIAVFLVALSLLLVSCDVQVSGNEVEHPDGSAPFEERMKAALSEISRREMPVIVAVSHNYGQTVTFHKFGAAAENPTPAAATQVDVNSITKTFTGVMAAKLMDEGLATADMTLGEIFTNVPSDKQPITLHQLLTHTAGFPESIGDDAEPIEKKDYLQRAFETKLKSEPGKKYSYSNAGYSIIAAIIEERSGKSYEEFLKEDVLSGLGLKDTGYISVYDENRSLKTVSGESIKDASWGGHAPYWNLIGNGGLISTAGDFIQFRRALTNGNLLSKEMLEALQSKQVAEDLAGTSHYGYGEVVQDNEVVGRVYWHDGGNDVFSAQWNDFADKGDLIFTAGADSNKGDAFEAMRIMAEYLYPDAKDIIEQ